MKLYIKLGLWATLLTCFVQQLQCEVDESMPNLSIYKLRRVDSSSESSERLNKPISDYATGAVQMYKSLFTNDFDTRCAAYAHLFKLVRRLNLEEQASEHYIKLDTIMALVTVVDSDRDEYEALFKLYQPNIVSEIFMEAIEQLERRHIQTRVIKDAWLELISCASHFSGPNLASFLTLPRRSQQIDTYRKLKSSQEGEQESSRRLFSDKEVAEARAKVELFDDEELREVRAKLRGNRVAAAAIAAEEKVAPIPDVVPDREQDAPFENDRLELELSVPDDSYEGETEQGKASSSQQQQQKPKQPSLDLDQIENQITALTFIKRWVKMLETNQRDTTIETKSKLTMGAAVDFGNFWKELEKLDLSELPSDLASRVKQFLADEENKRIHKRLQSIVSSYVQLTGIMNELQDPKRKFESMSELNATYQDLIDLLMGMDQLVQTYDLTRATLNKKKLELNEFWEINNFIQNDFW